MIAQLKFRQAPISIIRPQARVIQTYTVQTTQILNDRFYVVLRVTCMK